MKKIAVIISNNGLGHVKRVLFLLELFYKRFPSKVQTDIFVNIDKLKYFPSITSNFNKNKYKIRFFDVVTDGFNYEEEFLSKYKNHLGNADYIWSDNLIFPLKYRTDVFLTGSFLWIDVVDNTDTVKRKEEILLKNHPLMIANKYFATPKAKRLTNLVGVGMYEYFPFHIPDDFSYKILLSCGKSRQAKNFFEENLPVLREEIKKIPADIEIFIDPDYYEYFYPARNVKKANFTEKMFSSISTAVIRPGIGTVCDVLTKGGRIFSFFEENNSEMNHNAEVLEKLKVGERCQEVKLALFKAVDYLFDKELHEKHYASLKELDFRGLDETVTKINEILS